MESTTGHPDKLFRNGLAEGRIILPKCRSCGKFHFFPRLVCPHCHAMEFAWHPVSGRGEIHTTTVVRQKPEHGGDYNICMVELEEGVRMMSRVEGLAPQEVKIGMVVTAYIGEAGGGAAVLCKPMKG